MLSGTYGSWPARKAVWSSPGEPKASGNTFFLLSSFYLYSCMIMYVIFIFFLFNILSLSLI